MAIALCTDYDAAGLRAAARQSKDAGQTRRLLALASIYDGASRTEAAAMGGVMLHGPGRDAGSERGVVELGMPEQDLDDADVDAALELTATPKSGTHSSRAAGSFFGPNPTAADCLHVEMTLDAKSG